MQTMHSYVLDKPARILVVDDDPILREFASVHLSTPVAGVETAPDGNTALDLMLGGRFDIALIDIAMPGLDGFELVRRARAHETLRHLPIIMLTGREDIASIDRAYRLGATSFVTKPVNWRQLSYQLRYVIRASKLEAEARRAREHAQARIASKADGLRRMQHELCTTANSIIKFADLIAESGKPHCESVHAGYAASIAAAAQDLLCKFLDMAVEVEQTADAMSCGGGSQLPPLRDETNHAGPDCDAQIARSQTAA